MNDVVDELASPNRYGEMSFDIQMKPVSTQATRAKKDPVTAAIREQTEKIQYLLSADVAIEIVWHVHEQDRYESDETADVDNIVKPILDALSGPNGIIINDCQVQFISSHWVSRFEDDEHVTIKVKFDPEAWYPKKSLFFVQLHRALCMPINADIPPEAITILLKAFELQFSGREFFLNAGFGYEVAHGVMSIQRLFHRTRVSEFEVMTIKELRSQLQTKYLNSGGTQSPLRSACAP